MKKILIIIISVLSLCAAVLGALVSLNHIHYNVEKELEFTITTEEDFYFFIENYNQYNIVKLMDNIEIKQKFESIGNKQNQYNKVFDGQGYSITLLEEAKDTPLFGIIAESGVVKNLELFVNNCEITTASYGALAIQNKGTIINCLVDVNLVLSADSIVGGIAAVNEGKISYCYVGGIITKNISKEDSVKKSIVAGGVSFNNGTLDSIISAVEYIEFNETDSNNILKGELNNTIGIIYGINNFDVSAVKNCYYMTNCYYKDSVNLNSYVVIENYYLSDMKFVTNIMDLDIDFNKLALFDVFHFDNKIWDLKMSASTYEISLKDIE